MRTLSQGHRGTSADSPGGLAGWRAGAQVHFIHASREAQPVSRDTPDPVTWHGFRVYRDPDEPAGVAQLAEHPPCKRTVSGSNPLTGSTTIAAIMPHLPAVTRLLVVLVVVAIRAASAHLVTPADRSLLHVGCTALS